SCLYFFTPLPSCFLWWYAPLLDIADRGHASTMTRQARRLLRNYPTCGYASGRFGGSRPRQVHVATCLNLALGFVSTHIAS
ncbi:hypothetical protein BX600DRAFT_455354, partial [Xylariales sp. PMI_506]